MSLKSSIPSSLDDAQEETCNLLLCVPRGFKMWEQEFRKRCLYLDQRKMGRVRTSKNSYLTLFPRLISEDKAHGVMTMK